jgi:hypothetical protein
MYCILKADVHGCEIGFFKMSIWANGGHFDAIYRCFSICFYKWPSLAGRWLEIFICDVVRNKGLMHVKYFFLYVFSILLTLFKSSPNEMSNRGRHVPLVTETRTVFHEKNIQEKILYMHQPFITHYVTYKYLQPPSS